MINYRHYKTIIQHNSSRISKYELANIITHGIGVLLCLIFIPFLIRQGFEQSDPAIWFGVIIFGLSIFFVYLSSTAYHIVQEKGLKRQLQIIDHIAIYFLIAGTHTPLILMFLNNSRGQSYLIFLWCLVVIGVIYKLFFFGKYPLGSVIYYVVLAWMAVLILPDMLDQMSEATLYWLLVGGAFYTFGVIFFLWEKLPFHHSIWHVFVMLGGACHYVSIYSAISV